MREARVFCLVAKMYKGRLQIGAVTAGNRTSLVPKEYLDYADVFDASAAGILPEHHPMEHRIDLEPGKEPPWGPIYPLSEPELETLRLYLESSMEKGWIRRSTSPAGAPIMFVPKKDGGLWLCVDYRGLNRITVKNRIPLPLMTETFDRLRRAKVYTKIDLKDAYHWLRIRARDEWKTAFCTRYGHFEYQVVPFGLTNAPATFQAYINQALVGLVDVTCVVYLDDILIFSEDVGAHTAAVCEVLDRLRTHKLYANINKCVFFTDEVEYLGFIISPQGIRMDPTRIDTITDWPLPALFREVQMFLGFANFYRRFGSVEGKKPGPFRMTPEAIEAFA